MKVSKIHFFSSLFLLLVSFLFYYQVFIYQKIPVPSDTLIGLYHPWRDTKALTNPRGIPFKNYLITDPIRQQIPWRKLVIDSILKQRIPNTNFYSFSSNSLIGNIQAGVFYPLNILFIIFSFPVAWSLLIILQTVLSTLFMYMFLHKLRLGSISCILGSIFWTYSGFSIAWLTWGTIIHTSLWIPFLLFCVEELLEKQTSKVRKTLFFIFYIFGSTSSFFAGHSQVWLYSMIVVGSYFVYRLLSIDKREFARNIVVFLLAIVLVFVVSSVQLIPFIRTFLESSRSVETVLWQKEGWFIPWKHLIQFLIPDYYGNPSTLNYWGVWNYGEFIGYISIVGLFFSVIGMLLRKHNQNDFWIIILFVSLGFSIDSYLSVIPYILKIPIISSMQPTRLLVIVTFSLCILAANGIDAYIRGIFKIKNQQFLFGGVFVLILLCTYLLEETTPMTQLKANFHISFRNVVPQLVIVFIFIGLLSIKKYINNKIFYVILILISVIDLFRFGWKFTPFTDYSYFFPSTSTIEILKKDTELYRVISTDSQILPPNTNDYYGISTLSGYDPVFNLRYEEFIASLERGKPNISKPFGFDRIVEPKNFRSPLIKFLNVKYLLSFDPIDDSGFELIHVEGKTRLYKYKTYSPRVYIADFLIVKENKQKVLEELFSSSFSPFSALLEEPIDIKSNPLSSHEIINVTPIENNSYNGEVTLNQPRLVVFSEVFTDSLKIFVDNVQSPIIRVNYILCGVIIPKGKHTFTVL